MRNINEKCGCIGGEFLRNIKGRIKFGTRVGILFIFLFL